jgi:hypothetical protein
MNRLCLFSLLIILIACTETKKIESKIISTKDYQLAIPEQQESLLILFPCFPCDAENTRAEFDIIDEAIENKIAVLYMNFNLHLWLQLDEKKQLESIIKEAITINNLNINNTFMGGFSAGGNVSLLLGNYLKSSGSIIQPKGVFLVDSPIDLLGLYKNSIQNIKRNYSDIAVQESKWILDLFDSEFGIGDSSFVHYEMKSPYISKSHSIKNLTNLKNVKLRFYTEPDTIWWKKNRQTKYQEMNAYFIELLWNDLNKHFETNSIDLIKTKNKGYRANGDRHPHSWSIIDKKSFIEWIIEE